MHNKHFDFLTRLFVTSESRRNLMKVVGGGALAALAGQAVSREAAAACRVAGKSCNSGQQCCSGRCKGRRDKKTCRATRQGTCKPGQDFCAQGVNTTCNGDPNCRCHINFAGDPVCVHRFEGACAACTSDTECAGITGPGSACVVTINTAACPGCSGVGTACVRPCPRR